MAATNRVDVLDKALIRPGRFDRHIELTLPDLEARQEIFKIYLKNLKINHEENHIENLSKILST